jgi:hypothetical protein
MAVEPRYTLVTTSSTKEIKDLIISGTESTLNLRIAYDHLHVVVSLNEADCSQLEREISEWLEAKKGGGAKSIAELSVASPQQEPA